MLGFGTGLEAGERRLRLQLERAIVAVDLDIRIQVGMSALGLGVEVLAEEDAGAEICRPASSIEIADLERGGRRLGANENQLVSELQARIFNRVVGPEYKRSVGQNLAFPDRPYLLR